MQKIVWFLAAAVALTGISYPFMLIYVNGSPEYVLAKSYIMSSADVTASVGPIEKIYLRPMGFDVKESFGTGAAVFSTVVRGARGDATVRVCMRKRAGVWELAYAELSDNLIAGSKDKCTYDGE